MTIGIIGAGNIGSALTRHFRVLGSRLCGLQSAPPTESCGLDGNLFDRS